MTRPRPGTLLIVAFMVVVASFVATTAFLQVTSSRIDTAADAIAYDSSPSIQHLTAVRGEARELEYLLDEYLDARATGKPVGRSPVDASLLKLDDELQSYLTLPALPGERDVWKQLRTALRDLNSATQRVLGESDLNAAATARATFRNQLQPAAERLVEAALRGIEINASTGRTMAMEIKRVRNHAILTGRVLAGLCVLISILAAWMVHRQIRRHAALLEEQARFQESRSAELEMFAGRVAHDLVNPISAARMAVELVHATMEDDKRRGLLSRSMGSFRRAQSIIDGLLDFARAGARPAAGAQALVSPVVEEAVTDLGPMAERAGVSLAAETVPPVAAACSPGVLASLFMNLIQNAIKYMGERPERRVTVRVVDAGDRVRALIEDTGPGLSPQLAASIFEPYVRAPDTHQPGIGLGLATVKRLAEGHGGTVGVDSREGAGSVFWFELPKRPVAPA